MFVCLFAPGDEPSEIAAAVLKASELRVCIDPKPLNAALKREHYQISMNDDSIPDLASAFWQIKGVEHPRNFIATRNGQCRWPVWCLE